MSAVAVVDYGVGNLRSIIRAIERVAPGASVQVTGTPAGIASADRIVLPGQGAIQSCMDSLAQAGLYPALIQAMETKPCLCTCVGAQMLFDNSAEGGGTRGFGLIPGRVVRFTNEDAQGASHMQVQSSARLKIPQVGWNSVVQTQEHVLWAGVPDGGYFYFVHSYYMDPAQLDCVFGETVYGHPFVSVVAKSNVFATQFHPEKSAENGLRLYKNFMNWDP